MKLCLPAILSSYLFVKCNVNFFQCVDCLSEPLCFFFCVFITIGLFSGWTLKYMCQKNKSHHQGTDRKEKGRLKITVMEFSLQLLGVSW